MLKIGITGGIGSGKTTIAKIFSTLGIPIYNADGAAKALMNHDEKIKQALIHAFGNEIYSNEQLNSSFLASYVFPDVNKLEQLNAIVHPAVIADANKWFNHQHNVPYAIKEAALIFESGSEKYLNLVICVTAPETLRKKRIIKRDGISEEDIVQRMRHQMNEKEKIKRSNFVIKNNNTLSVITQIMDLHKEFLTLSNR